MGPKYEFTGETIRDGGYVLHRIRRIEDDKLGGWIAKEENLSQEGNCWVDDNAKVKGDAKVYGNAKVYGDAEVAVNARVYGNAKVYGNAEVYGDAEVYGNAQVSGTAWVWNDTKVYDNAKVYGDAQVHGNARVYDHAEVYGSAIVCGNAEVDYEISSGRVGDDSTDENTDENTEVLKDFVYKIDDSSKLDVQTNYDSVDAFFEDTTDESYVEHECLTIIAVDTKVPILKLEKAQVKDKNVFKFVVDITNEDGDDYRVRSVIDSKDKFNQLLQSTIESLNSYPQFEKYAKEIEDCV